MDRQRLIAFLLLNLFFGSAVSLRLENIVNGYQLPERYIHYKVSIQVYGGHLCTGSLIASDTVLSAGHCFHDGDNNVKYDEYTVVAGTTDLKNSKGSTLKVARVYLHSEYVKYLDEITGYLHIINDIAVLKLAGHFDTTYRTKIKVGELPDENAVYNGQLAEAYGFGADRIQRKLVPNDSNDLYDLFFNKTLKSLSLRIKNDYECRDSHIMYCALPLGKNQGICAGDSGGPLEIIESKQNGFVTKIVGIISFGPSRCSDHTRPQYFTKVPVYLKWIKQAMADEPTSAHKLIDNSKNIVQLPEPDIFINLYDRYWNFFQDVHMSKPMVLRPNSSELFRPDLV